MTAILCALVATLGVVERAFAAEAADDDEVAATDPCDEPPGEGERAWIDRLEAGLESGSCRSARWIDGLFGEPADPAAYKDVSGSVAPSLLWTEFDGFKTRVRFRVDLPLPQVNSRLRAFVGRTNRDEAVRESVPAGGPLPRQLGVDDDETLLGLGYGRAPGEPGFSASAGVRLRTPPDPFVKASYRFVWADEPGEALRLRPTAFWELEEGLGVTTRVDYDRDLAPDWYSRLTASGTFSETSQGLRYFSGATLFHRVSPRRAVAAELSLDGETDAEVPVREFGLRTTFRQIVWREWLAIELRASLTWPRERLDEPRAPSWGAGLGFELVFGEGDFRGN